MPTSGIIIVPFDWPKKTKQALMDEPEYSNRARTLRVNAATC